MLQVWFGLSIMIDKDRQRKMLKSIVGSARLEGLEIDGDTLSDANRVIEKEISTNEAIARLMEKSKHRARA